MGQTEVVQSGELPFDLGHGTGQHRWPRQGGHGRRGHPGVASVRTPVQAGDGFQAGSPAGWGWVGERLDSEDRFGHQPDELLFAGNVVIKGHRPDIHRGRDAAHGQGGEALGVGHRDGGGDDRVLAECGAVGSAFRGFFACKARTTVPIPGRASTRSCCRRVVSTLVAVAIATCQSRAICRVDGTRSPGASAPDSIRPRISSAIS